MNDDKRQYRELKRDIKKAGNRKLRRSLQRQLAETPTEAHEAEVDHGRLSSASMNGNDKDATRRRTEEEVESDEEE